MDNSILYHYTSIEKLFRILGSDSDDICLWATHSQYLNDPFEYDYAIKILIQSLKDFEEKNNIQIRKSEYLKLNDNIFHDLSFLGGAPFLLSFSENQDDLIMWRTYGTNGTGVSIGFDKAELNKSCNQISSYNTSLIKCDYNLDKIKIDFNNLWEQEYSDMILSNDGNSYSSNNFSLAFEMSKLCFRIKSIHYENEKEWRLCKNDFNEKNVKYRIQNNLIIPYIEHYFKKSIIKKVVIGPCRNGDLSKKSITMFLNKNDFKIDKDFIVESSIPYRLI